MPFPVPTNLSASRVEAFTSCPLAFRFASIEKLPEPPVAHTTKGSLVHRALELLYCRSPADRTLDAGLHALAEAVAEYRTDPEFTGLGLDADEEARFLAEAEALVRRYFTMEDPAAIREIGIELYLEARVGRLTLRGIIDRLELDAEGELVVTDYKTGRPPSVQREQQRLGGVHFYAFLCHQVFGRRPARIQLMYLSTGEVIVAHPSEQSIEFLPRRTAAVWHAVERACEAGDFRPRVGPLCDYCAFKAWCPAWGGNPDRAAFEAPVAYAQGAVQLPLAMA
jgi:putative RecB family exonuclease